MFGSAGNKTNSDQLELVLALSFAKKYGGHYISILMMSSHQYLYTSWQFQFHVCKLPNCYELIIPPSPVPSVAKMKSSFPKSGQFIGPVQNLIWWHQLYTMIVILNLTLLGVSTALLPYKLQLATELYIPQFFFPSGVPDFLPIFFWSTDIFTKKLVQTPLIINFYCLFGL